MKSMHDKQKADILAQYFNYGFTEETFKTYINQHVQKLYQHSKHNTKRVAMQVKYAEQ